MEQKTTRKGSLTEGKEGRSSELRTKAWSRVGDGDNDGVVFGERRHRRPGFGRLCRLNNLVGARPPP